MRKEETFQLNIPADKVLAILTDPKFIEHDEKSRDTLEVEIQDLEKTADKHHYMVKTTTYGRGLTGVDKNKREKNRVTQKWDLKKMSSNWSWEGDNEFASRTKISGITTVKPKGSGSELQMVVDLEISVPLIGGKISKIVAGEFAKEWPKFVERVKKWNK